MLPFVTHAMSPAEYGAASTLTAAALLLTSLLAAPLIQLIVRAAARGDEDGPALLRVTGLYCYLLLPIAVAVIAAVFAFFVPDLFGVKGTIWAIEVLAIGFQPAASTFAMWVAQAREDLPRFVWLSATSVLVTAVSKLVLVVFFQMGVLGWVLSDLTSAVFSALLAVSLVRLPRAKVLAENVHYAVKFTLPLIPHAASLWALMSLSRPVMAAVAPLEQVGLLSFGLNLASVAILVLSESNRAVLPRYSCEVFPAPTRETFAPVAWQLIAAFLVPAIVGAGVAAVGGFIFAEAYWPSFFLTGVLLVGQAAYGLYLIPMNYLTQTAGLPKFSSLASGSGAVLILVSILLLAPRYGAEGVAYATVAGYAAMALVAFILSAMHKLDIAWRSWAANWPGVALAAGALVMSVVALIVPVRHPLAFAASGICFVLVLSAIVVTRLRNNLRD
ncbi:lipopolysaccharide biosynthesis protein [Mycolicibacterium hodleri]